MADAISGRVRAGRNWSADAGSGSIHDDATATRLGFRGGTVAGSVHMNQFVPVLLELFGDRWFEAGNLSLNFKNATVDGERVQVFAEPLQFARERDQQTRVWMEREDGLLVCTGTAAVGNHDQSELRARDLRPSNPSELTILRNVTPGLSLGRYELDVPSARQFELFDGGLISEPLDVYRTNTRFGGIVACPSTIVQLLWGVPMAGLRARLTDAVGLFGAIEVGHANGPLLLDAPCVVTSHVVCVGQSPKTEYLWFDSTASDTGGESIATFRMMLRFMKT